jgi:predicted ATPase/DNA-binding XRE family transcriptional regulator
MHAIGGVDSFGEQLRRYREAAGLTREQLAERSGLTASGIAALERGRRRHPYPHTVHALADALELAAEERAQLAGAVPSRDGTAATLVAMPSPLPIPATDLIGREREAKEIRDLLLGAGQRLITLLGPGGVGKTRLALEIASGMGVNFPDGVTFIRLAPVDDPTLVLPTIARSLGVVEVAGQPPIETLRAYGREKRLLLVLDNCEHVIGAAPEVAALLTSCPGLKALATSRSAFRVRGEQEYQVRPLTVPNLARTRDPDEVAESAAVQLFLQRAREVSPTLELSRSNAAAVAAISRRLDGLPLAIELAAARMRAMSPTELLARLDRSLPLLSGGPRDLPERQRTMRAAIEWSYQLLQESEWRLLNRLSVFRGGWDMEAAEAVGAGENILEEDVLDLLSSLVEQSLVVAERGADDATRYRMLVPVREYVEERLDQSGEADGARRRHAENYLALAKEAAPELRGARQVEWLDQLETEYDNLRAAMAWLLSSGAVDAAALLGWSLWVFWWLHGHQAEGRRRMEELVGHKLSPRTRAMALVTAAPMAYAEGDYEVCERYNAEGLVLSKSAGDTVLEAHALVGLGLAAMGRRDHGTATSRLEAALPLLRVAEGGATGIVPLVHTWLGTIALARGNPDGARSLLDTGLMLARSRGDRLGTSNALYGLAVVAHTRGHLDEAERYLREGVEVSAQLRDRANLANMLEGLATVAVERGEPVRAAHLFGAAEGMLEAVGASIYHYYSPDRTRYERAKAAVRERLGSPASETLWAEGRAMTPEQAVAYAVADRQDRCGKPHHPVRRG